MLVTGWRAEALFGLPEALISAVRLVNDGTITVDHTCKGVEYFHILFDAHEIITAEGAESESYYPLAADLPAFNAAQQAELLELFPELGEVGSFRQIARPTLSVAETALLA